MGRRLWKATIDDESDEQLTERVRGGDEVAYGELYCRHRRAAESTARCLVRSRADADDVVADAFAGVLSAIRNGRGPRDNFRRYLLACVRNGCRTRRRTIPFAPSDALFEPTDGGQVLLEDPERFVEADIVARAFSELTPRWQQMLWSTAVEQKSAQEMAQAMRLSPNAAAALAHRAREAFATAYLTEHLGAAPSHDCRRHVPHLAAYVRNQLPAGRTAALDQHLVDCAGCAGAVADLRDVNTSLRSLLPPGVLAAAASSLPTPASGTGSVGGGAASWPMSGVLVKSAAGLLLLAPVLLTDSSGFDGGLAEDLAVPVLEVRQAAAAPDSPATTEPRDPPATTPSSPASSPTPRPPDDGLEDQGGAGENRAPNAVGGQPTGGAAAGAGAPGGGGSGAGPVGGDGGRTPAGNPPGTGAPAAPSTASPTVPGAANDPESPTTTTVAGLLSSLGVDDAVGVAGVEALNWTVAALDTLVYEATSEAVAPIVGLLLAQLPLDLGPTPEVPGVVLFPETTAPPLLPELVPDITLPVTLPQVQLPQIPAPDSELPQLTLPQLGGGSSPSTTQPSQPTARPAVTQPAATSPPVTAPPVSVPPVTVPPVTVPPVTVPPVTQPPVTVPPATQPPATSPPSTLLPSLDGAVECVLTLLQKCS